MQVYTRKLKSLRREEARPSPSLVAAECSELALVTPNASLSIFFEAADLACSLFLSLDLLYPHVLFLCVSRLKRLGLAPVEVERWALETSSLFRHEYVFYRGS